MPQKSFSIEDRDTNRLFDIAFGLMDDYPVGDGRSLRYERAITTTITTASLVSGALYKGSQKITFANTFSGASPKVFVSAYQGNGDCWSSLKSLSKTACTVTLYSFSATGTGKIQLFSIGK